MDLFAYIFRRDGHQVGRSYNSGLQMMRYKENDTIFTTTVLSIVLHFSSVIQS